MELAHSPGRRSLGEAALTGLQLSLIAFATFAFALIFALALYVYPVPLGGGVAVGIGLLAILALALTRYELAVWLGFLSFGVVFVEPSPTDLFFGILIVVSFMTGRFHLRRVPVLVQALVGLFLALNILGAAAMVDAGRAVGFFGVTVYLVLFAAWLCSYVDSPQRARRVVSPYLYGAALWAAISLVALFASIPWQETFITFDRARGLFKDPNVFGPFLVPAALVAIGELTTPRSRRLTGLSSKALTILFALSVTGVLFSFSRAGWLNLSVGIVVMGVITALRRGGAGKAMLYVTIVLVGFAFVGMVLSATDSVAFLKQRAQLQAYDTTRFKTHETGIRLIEDYPFGIGPGQFEPALPDVPAAHSLYIRGLAEEGFLGFAVLAGLVLVTLLMALRNAALGLSTYGLGSSALLASWCGLIANSFFVDTLHWRHLWLVAALIWAGAMRVPPVRPRSAPGRVATVPRPPRAPGPRSGDSESSSRRRRESQPRRFRPARR